MMQALPSNYMHDYGGAGQPLVLLGDILGGHASWSRQAEALAKGWHVYGISPVVVAAAEQGEPPAEGWSLIEEGQALADALSGHGIEQAHIGGWSLGGAVALEFALSNPDRVTSLTLVEPPSWWLLRRMGRNLKELAETREAFSKFANVAAPEERLVGDFLRQVGALAPSEQPQESRAWRLAWLHRHALSFSWRVIQHDDHVSRLARLTMPVLLVCGRDSLPIDRATFQALREQLPHAQALELPGGHTSHLVNVDAFVIALERFLMQAES